MNVNALDLHYKWYLKIVSKWAQFEGIFKYITDNYRKSLIWLLIYYNDSHLENDGWGTHCCANQELAINLSVLSQSQWRNFPSEDM